MYLIDILDSDEHELLILLDRNPNSDPFTVVQFPTAMSNIQHLCQLTNIYPSPDQQVNLGHKRWTLMLLSQIAQNVTKTPFPIVVQIATPMAPDLVQRQNLYVKREFSENSEHVLAVSNTNDFKARFRGLIQETDRLYNHAEIRDQGIQPSWLGLAFIEEMKSLGELRVFFIGGEMKYIIWTKQGAGDGDLQITNVTHVAPLELIR